MKKWRVFRLFRDPSGSRFFYFFVSEEHVIHATSPPGGEETFFNLLRQTHK